MAKLNKLTAIKKIKFLKLTSGVSFTFLAAFCSWDKSFLEDDADVVEFICWLFLSFPSVESEDCEFPVKTGEPSVANELFRRLLLFSDFCCCRKLLFLANVWKVRVNSGPRTDVWDELWLLAADGAVSELLFRNGAADSCSSWLSEAVFLETEYSEQRQRL